MQLSIVILLAFTFTVTERLYRSSASYAVGRWYVCDKLWTNSSILWQMYIIASFTLPFVAFLYVMHWKKNCWSLHPVAQKLRAFTTDVDIKQIFRDIDTEFRGPFKLIIPCDPTSKVVVTANWIIKTSSYSMDFAHQSDVSLEVVAADEHNIAPDTVGGVQYIQIKVSSSRPNVKPFVIRINSSHFKDLQDRLVPPIKILENVIVQSTVVDRFLIAFKNLVKQNPVIDVQPQVNDVCWGCSEKIPNIKLTRTCGDTEGSNPCSICYCRPMWCVDCIGTWFASRQEQDRPDQWMFAKCSCPLCRSTFCVLDVCHINEITENGS